jgi:atypical dual specificity phosphatase
MLFGFSYILPGRLAGMAGPSDLNRALPMLADQNIGGVISLTARPLDAARLRQAGIDYLHLPVSDFTPPRPDQVEQMVAFVDDVADRRQAGTVVHCAMGLGRTGTMLACYLVSQGYDPHEAVREVRRLRPGSIETAEQEALVHEWARRREQADRGPADERYA